MRIALSGAGVTRFSTTLPGFQHLIPLCSRDSIHLVATNWLADRSGLDKQPHSRLQKQKEPARLRNGYEQQNSNTPGQQLRVAKTKRRWYSKKVRVKQWQDSFAVRALESAKAVSEAGVRLALGAN